MARQPAGVGLPVLALIGSFTIVLVLGSTFAMKTEAKTERKDSTTNSLPPTAGGSGGKHEFVVDLEDFDAQRKWADPVLEVTKHEVTAKEEDPRGGTRAVVKLCVVVEERWRVTGDGWAPEVWDQPGRHRWCQSFPGPDGPPKSVTFKVEWSG